MQKYNNIQEELEKIIENSTPGSPEKVILWTAESLRNLEKALYGRGFNISHDTVGNALKEMGYSLQQNQKMLQAGVPHPDRNARFEYINRKCGGFIQEGQPVISEKGTDREFQEYRQGIPSEEESGKGYGS